jgi:hypothetical protein
MERDNFCKEKVFVNKEEIEVLCAKNKVDLIKNICKNVCEDFDLISGEYNNYSMEEGRKDDGKCKYKDINIITDYILFEKYKDDDNIDYKFTIKKNKKMHNISIRIIKDEEILTDDNIKLIKFYYIIKQIYPIYKFIIYRYKY